MRNVMIQSEDILWMKINGIIARKIPKPIQAFGCAITSDERYVITFGGCTTTTDADVMCLLMIFLYLIY